MMKHLEARWKQLDRAMIAFMTAHGTRLLRVALAVTFIWFGALKVAGRSPVADLVAQTVYWLPPTFFVQLLGWWELVIGVGLLSDAAPLRLVLLLFWVADGRHVSRAGGAPRARLSVWESVAADSGRRICDQEPRPHRGGARDREHGSSDAGMTEHVSTRPEVISKAYPSFDPKRWKSDWGTIAAQLQTQLLTNHSSQRTSGRN